VIGCGRVFERFHLPAITRVAGVSLVAACDTDPGRLTWGEGRLVPPILSTTPAELLTCPGLEAVFVLTPPSSHAHDVAQALRAGLHVMVEKPMALRAEDARHMVQAALSAQRHLQVGFARRFRAPYQKLKAALRQQDSPTLSAVRFDLSFPTGSWKAASDFLGDESRGGGVLDDVLSHQVDLLCWLMNGWPEQVRCTVKNPSGAITTELKIGSVTARCDSAHARYAERLELELADGRVLEATGSSFRQTRAGLEPWRRSRALVLDRIALLGDRLLRRPNVSLRSFEDQVRDFARAVRLGHSVGATADDGLRAVEIVQACRASAQKQGQWQAMETTAKSIA
jgi:predicted dehydrogenase